MSEPVVPVVIVLAGGEVLLRGSAVAAVLTALRAAVRMNRIDGSAPSGALRAVEGAFTQAKARQVVLRHLAPELVGTSTGAAEYPDGAGLAESDLEDPMTVQEAAVMTNTSERNVRALCARQTLVTARLVGGRWVMDRADVLGYIERKAC